MADITFKNRKDGTTHTINIPDGLTEEQQLHAIGMYLDDPNLSNQPGPVKPTDISKTPKPEDIVQPVNTDVNAPTWGQRVQNRIIASMPAEEDTGFFPGLQRGAINLWNSFRHPLSAIPPQYGSMEAADKAYDPLSSMQGNPVSRAAAGDYSGLVGEAVPPATLAALGLAAKSPKMRATVREGIKGAFSAADPSKLKGLFTLAGMGGGGYTLSKVGKVLGGPTGEIAGAAIGTGLPMTVGGIKGAIKGFRSAPWMEPIPEVHQAHFVYPGDPDYYHRMGGERTTKTGPLGALDPRTTQSQYYYDPEWSVDIPGQSPRPYSPETTGDFTDPRQASRVFYQGPAATPNPQLALPGPEPQISPAIPDVVRDIESRPPFEIPKSDQELLANLRKNLYASGMMRRGIEPPETTPLAKSSSEMKDVRRNFKEAPPSQDNPDKTASPAPNDLKEKKVPDKKQFSSEKKETKQKPVTAPKKKTAPDPKDVVAQIDKDLKAKTETEKKIDPSAPNTITSPETAPLKDKFTRGDIAEISNNLGVTQSMVARHLIGEGYEVEDSKFGDNWGLKKRGIKASLKGDDEPAQPKLNLKDPKYAKQLEAVTKKYKKKGS